MTTLILCLLSAVGGSVATVLSQKVYNWVKGEVAKVDPKA